MHYLTIYVSPTGTDTNTGTNWNNTVKTITTALSLVQENGTIILAEGTYTQPTWIFKNIKLKSDKGAHKTILTNTGSSYCTIYTFRTLFIEDISFQNCSAYYGSAITNYGTLHCTNCIFQNCSSGLGGAISNSGETTTCLNCIFKDCKSTTSSAEGGAIYNNAQFYINNCKFINNTANTGGAISNMEKYKSHGQSYNTANTGGVIYSYNYQCPGIINNNTLFQDCEFQYNNATQGNIAYTDNCISSWIHFNHNYFQPDNTNNFIGLITNNNPIPHTPNNNTNNTTTPTTPITTPTTYITPPTKINELINLINHNTLTPIYAEPTNNNTNSSSYTTPNPLNPYNTSNPIIPGLALAISAISLITTLTLYLKPRITKTATQDGTSQQLLGNSIITYDMLEKIEFKSSNTAKTKEINHLIEKIKSNPHCCPCCTSILYILTLLQKDKIFTITKLENWGTILEFILGPFLNLYTLIKNRIKK